MLYTSFSVGARHTLLETERLWWGGDVEECWMERQQTKFKRIICAVQKIQGDMEGSDCWSGQGCAPLDAVMVREGHSGWHLSVVTPQIVPFQLLMI